MSGLRKIKKKKEKTRNNKTSAAPFKNVRKTIWLRAHLPGKQTLGSYANAEGRLILSHVAYHSLRHFRGVTLLGWLPLKKLRARISFKINSSSGGGSSQASVGGRGKKTQKKSSKMDALLRAVSRTVEEFAAINDKKKQLNKNSTMRDP